MEVIFVFITLLLSSLNANLEPIFCWVCAGTVRLYLSNIQVEQSVCFPVTCCYGLGLSLLHKVDILWNKFGLLFTLFSLDFVSWHPRTHCPFHEDSL
jgi:hypothetical protein